MGPLEMCKLIYHAGFEFMSEFTTVILTGCDMQRVHAYGPRQNNVHASFGGIRSSTRTQRVWNAP